MKHFKIATFVGTGAIITGALFGAVPSPVAFAACNEGTPNCLQVDGGHERAQDQVNQGTTVGQCEGPNGFCDDSIAGSDVQTQEGAAKPPTKKSISVDMDKTYAKLPNWVVGEDPTCGRRG